jgi:hypothetical protein
MGDQITMEWIKYPENKPEKSVICIVVNTNWSNVHYLAFYEKEKDLFVLYNPECRNHLPIQITHFIAIPEWPKGKS